MGRIGPNEVRGGPNRVSAQRRRRLCRALRGALCGGLREGVRGYAGVCGGVECVGTGRVAGRLRGRVLRGGSVAAGGLSGWRADGAQRRTGWRDEGVRGWWLWRVADGLLRGSCGTAAVGWPVVEAVGCRPGRRLRGLAAGVVASGKECFGGRNASGGGMRGDCWFCCGMGRRMDVEELTGRRGFCPRGGLSRWKADGAQRRKGRS